MAVTDREIAEGALNASLDNNALILALIKELHKVGVKVDMNVIEQNAKEAAAVMKEQVHKGLNK